jgi:hypothetical protein
VLRYLARRQSKYVCSSLPGTATLGMCMCFVTWHGGYVLHFLARRQSKVVYASLPGLLWGVVCASMDEALAREGVCLN